MRNHEPVPHEVLQRMIRDIEDKPDLTFYGELVHRLVCDLLVARGDTVNVTGALPAPDHFPRKAHTPTDADRATSGSNTNPDPVLRPTLWAVSTGSNRVFEDIQPREHSAAS